MRARLPIFNIIFAHITLYLFNSLLVMIIEKQMVRRVFFSFHYERDAWRSSQVRNSWVTKPNREEAGYIDSAKWEEVKRQGNPSIKRWIDDQLNGTSVTVVLIGAETSQRDWVKYEIQQSHDRGNGVIGIRIHNLKDQNGETDEKGDTDFGLIDGEHTFEELFTVYDWVDDNGYENIGDWVEQAALVAKRPDLDPPKKRSARPNAWCVR